MKWFKHISDSLDDPFIFSLMEEFGGDGYLVFFGVLEIYSREFSPKDDWILTEKLSYFRHKLLISCSKFKKILSKINKWEVSYNGDTVSIYIPKFRELLDESTLKKLREHEKSFRNVSGIIPKTEVTDKEEDKDKDKDKEEEKNIEDYVKAELSPCPHQEIISLYHEILPELPPVKIWNTQRQAILRARWTEDPDRQCMEWWREYFGRVRASPFLMGQEKEFRASLEWIIRPKNMPKVIEGFYAKRNGNGKRHAGIKAWLERENDETGQGTVCQGDGSSGGDIRPGAGAVGI